MQCQHIAEPRLFCPKCAAIAWSELEQWRSGKRRVFWRVNYPTELGDFSNDFVSKSKAVNSMREDPVEGHKLYRVTVRPRVSI